MFSCHSKFYSIKKWKIEFKKHEEFKSKSEQTDRIPNPDFQSAVFPSPPTNFYLLSAFWCQLVLWCPRELQFHLWYNPIDFQHQIAWISVFPDCALPKLSTDGLWSLLELAFAAHFQRCNLWCLRGLSPILRFQCERNCKSAGKFRIFDWKENVLTE